MPDRGKTPVISKKQPTQHSLDYEFLRSEGLKHIEKLSGKIWTDYNIHDPGITILELLCYAITDLGYRASYDIQDILVDDESITIHGENCPDKIHKQFFTAAEILPTRPVTINDFRKLLIDIYGVKNAWLEKADEKLYANCRESKLESEKSSDDVPYHEVTLQGLYKVNIELEKDEDIDIDRLKQEVILRGFDVAMIELEDGISLTSEDIIKFLVSSILNQNRNLCEDFCEEIETIKRQEFIICAEIDVDVNVDINEMQAAIFYEIQKFLTTSVSLYSLQEMLDKSMTTDEIFDGPVLLNGFIDDKELKDASLRESINLSDIMRVIMNIKGIKALRDIIINPKNQSTPIDNIWTIPVTVNSQPVLVNKFSRIVFYKDVLPFQADKDEVDKLLGKMRQKEKKNPNYEIEDLLIPEGKFRDFQRYYSFQNHFPLNYGIGEVGFPDLATPTRKAQARQLKAYLLFYDQILANFLAQLAHIKDLFSLDETVKHTYFTQAVTCIKDVEELYADYYKLKETIQNIVEEEDKELFLKRRNVFLDHLLARFNETFNEYVSLMSTFHSQKGKQNIKMDSIQKEVIASKLNFLIEYPEISNGRAKAFDYTDRDNLWDTNNVSGLKHKVARLLGINYYQRCNLVNIKYDIYEEKDTDTIIEYRFRVIELVNNEKEEILLSSSKKYLDKVDADMEMKKAVKYAMNRDNYELKDTVDGRYYFNIVDDHRNVLARRIEYFDSIEERNNAINYLVDFLNQGYNDEGFFVLEHILLRRQQDTDIFLPICVEPDCSDCQNADPYSFRISVIVPAWPERFLNIEFRRFFEKTIRLETPAHIMPRICWINWEQMKKFEEYYKEWLEYHANSDGDTGSDALNKFIDLLCELRSVYPEAALLDCTAIDYEKNPFILNRTMLGTKKDRGHEQYIE